MCQYECWRWDQPQDKSSPSADEYPAMQLRSDANLVLLDRADHLVGLVLPAILLCSFNAFEFEGVRFNSLPQLFDLVY